jgi:hypothetical protein
MMAEGILQIRLLNFKFRIFEQQEVVCTLKQENCI